MAQAFIVTTLHRHIIALAMALALRHWPLAYGTCTGQRDKQLWHTIPKKIKHDYK